MNRADNPEEICDVVLVDPDQLFREAMAGILGRNGFEVVHAAPSIGELDRESLWRSADRQKLLVIDLGESDQDLRMGFAELIPAPEVKLVGISRTLTSEKLRLALDLGFHACLTKDISFESFHKYVRLVLSGESIFPIGLAQVLLSDPGHSGTRKPQVFSRSLNSREYAILGYLTQGDSNKMIARRLGVSSATVKVNLKTLFRKLDFSNRTTAAAWAVRKGILANGDIAGPGRKPVDWRPGDARLAGFPAAADEQRSVA